MPDSTESDISRIREAIANFPVDRLEELRAIIDGLIKEKKVTASKTYLKSGRHLVESRTINHVIYQLEKVKCGKPTCKCNQEDGELHGPYWYLYRWNGKKVVSQYIGKTLPRDLTS